MPNLYKKVLYAAVTLALMISVASCGLGGGEDDEETQRPAIVLSASTVTSAPAGVDNHTHAVSISFTDPGGATQVNYQSGTTSGHTHVIALSSAQFADVRAGMRVTATSTTVNGHSHTWTILGGSFLYDFMCYNCHSDTKRGTRGMSSNSLTSAQRDALQNPSAAPVSIAAPADPNTIPPPVPLDGTALYAANCSSNACHGPLASSNKRGVTAAQIRTGITNNSGGMGSLSGLTDAQLSAIATALQ